MTEIDLRYPIGRFAAPETFDGAAREAAQAALAAHPAELAVAVAGLAEAQLDTPYREGGWTVRQVVHHLADSHLNAYARTRLALTEQEPTIRVYDEKLWAELADARSGPVAPSLALLAGLHERWVSCLRAQEAPAFDRPLRHPERGLMTLGRLVALYAWHGRHHVAQVTALARRCGWS